MKRFLVAACLAAGILASTSSSAIVTGPRITSAVRSWNGDVTVTWVNANGPQVILWQCVSSGCYDTIWPNTGSHLIAGAPQPDVVQICVGGTVQDSCSQTVPVL